MSNGQDLDGRKALVTGSATGLGRAMAIKLAERGADLVVNYSRSAKEAEEAADLCRAAGAEIHLVQAERARVADEVAALTEGSVIPDWLADYAVLRDQVRACR